jgi:hypothetical protein
MWRLSPRHDRRSEPLLHRLDRAADQINPFLIVLIVGLVVLNLARLVTIGLANFPITRVDPSCLISPSAPTRSAGT